MTEKSEIAMTIEPEAVVEAQAETLFAGKYKTVEELTAAYVALAAPAEVKTETVTEVTEEALPASKEIPTEESAQAVVENAGLDWSALNTEYATDGKLSDATYEALAAKGLPREEVDTYIAGKQAQADAYDAAVYGTAGGTAEYASLVEWAKTALTREEKVAFNEAVTSGNAAKAKLAVEALNGRRSQKRGTPPGTLLNGGGGATGVTPFNSQVEVTAAMRSNAYKTDPAFRAEVVERLRLSSF